MENEVIVNQQVQEPETKNTVPPPQEAETSQNTEQLNERIQQYIKQAEELLNIEEMTVVYRGVRQPQTPSQLSVELSALRSLIKVLESRIASLEHEWSIILEKQRIVRSLVEAEKRDSN